MLSSSALLLVLIGVVGAGLAYWGYEFRRLVRLVREESRSGAVDPTVLWETMSGSARPAEQESGRLGRLVVARLILAEIELAEEVAEDMTATDAEEIVKRMASASPADDTPSTGPPGDGAGLAAARMISHPVRISMHRRCASFLLGRYDRREPALAFLYRLGRQLGLGETAVERGLADAVLGLGGPWREGGGADDARAREVLGVDEPVTWEDLRGRYRLLIRRYHPDRANGASVKRRVYGRVTKRVNWAFEHLSRQLKPEVVDLIEYSA